MRSGPTRKRLCVWFGFAGLVALAVALGWRQHPDRRAVSSDGENPVLAPGGVSILPLVVAITGIIAIGAAWIASEGWMQARETGAVARALTGGDPANAAALVRRYGCGGCHSIPGLPGADGEVAPPLGGVRKRVFIGGVLPNTADNLIDWIVDPQTYSPRSAMPVTGISKSEARDIAAYLYAH
jgi:cytochrome c2